MPACTNAAALDLGHDLLNQRARVQNSYPGFVYSVIRSLEWTPRMMKSSTAFMARRTSPVLSTAQSRPRNASAGKNRFCPSCMYTTGNSLSVFSSYPGGR